ncbi:putative disease resistance RPP13-like protein 1 [Vitis vinifera]|uniref:Putative disease resistance RPP13-like protein 1 n=1 Tax=Vitis vinifera TaxID=29760 RepID=A0A438J6P3_VITVI|nr:putative disease resistance RPP13-like protein 1 [Vitis vinifera]
MAGAIVGGALLSASIEVLLHRMASREVRTFLPRQRLSATLLRKLRIKLLAVQDLLDDITTEALRCKMESDAQTSATQALEKNCHKDGPRLSLVDESGEVYGREGNIQEIVEYLLSHNASGNKISVIALVGMGGIGKTTLAKLVYNDRRVVECFDLKLGFVFPMNLILSG